MLAHPLFRPVTLSLSLVLAALLLTMLCWPLCQWYPAAFLLAAVLVAAWRWGLWQGLITTATAMLPLPFIFRNAGAVDGFMPWSEVAWRLGLFGLVGGLTSYLTHLCLWARAAVARLDDTLTAVDDALIFTDNLGQVCRLNLVAESLTGWKSEDAMGQPLEMIFKVVSGDSKQAFVVPLTKVIREGALFDLPLDAVLSGTQGREVCIEGRAAPYRPEPDGPTGMAVVFRDVTRRAQEDREFRKRAEQFRSLASHAPVSLLFLDVAGRCMYANAAWQEASGLPESECQGDGWASALHGDDRGRVVTEWQHALRAGREFCGECRLKPRRGETRWLRISSAPMLSDRGQLLGHVGVLEDTDARKHAEASLLDCENRFTAVMKNFPGLAFLQDSQGRYVYANDAYARALGGEPGDCDGKTDLDLLGSKVENPFCSHQGHVLEYQDDRECAEAIHRDAAYLVHQFAVPSPERSNVLFGALAIDITAQKDAEKALREAREEFERRWNERANDLKRSEESLKKVRTDSERQLSESAARQKQAEEMLQSARQELEPLRRQIGELNAGRRKHEEALKAATDLLDEQSVQHATELEALRAQLAEQRALVTPLQEQLVGQEEVATQIAELESQNRTLQERLASLERERDHELDQLAEEEDKLSEENRALQEQVRVLTEECEQLRRATRETPMRVSETSVESPVVAENGESADTHQILVHSWRLVENMESWRAPELPADWLSYN